MSRIMLAVLTFTATCGAANAAVLYTPYVRVAVGEGVTCNVVNLSAQTRSFTLELVDGSGGSIQCSGTVPAGGARWCTWFSIATAPMNARYCRITVPDAAKANMRGGISNETTGVSFSAE